MFFQAAMTGNVQDVKEILRTNPNLNVNWRNENDDDGSTALITACDHGHDSIVFILLAHPDIDVNQKDINGWTPLLGCLLVWENLLCSSAGEGFQGYGQRAQQ